LVYAQALVVIGFLHLTRRDCRVLAFRQPESCPAATMPSHLVQLFAARPVEPRPFQGTVSKGPLLNDRFEFFALIIFEQLEKWIDNSRENEIIQCSKLPKRVQVTVAERNKLVKLGRELGRALRDIVSIVHPETLMRWIREEKRDGPKQAVKKGRPRTAKEIKELILKFARENGWGYTRIMGELKKLGIKPPSRNTVKNILKANGYEPGPNRGEKSWGEFLKMHADSLWQCDFYSKKSITLKGFRDLYLLVFIHVGTRRVFVAPSTFHPTEAWVRQQMFAFHKHAEDNGLAAKMIMHDRDSKFSTAIDELLENELEVEVKKSPHRAPNTNAFVERVIQTLQQECLDRFIVFGEQHMDHIVAEFLEHYHLERPHQSMDNEPLVKIAQSSVVEGEVHCRERLGGLLHHYYRAA